MARFSLVRALFSGSSAAVPGTTIDTPDRAIGDTLVLPVRAHQVTSDTSLDLSSQLTEEEIAAVFEGREQGLASGAHRLGDWVYCGRRPLARRASR